VGHACPSDTDLDHYVGPPLNESFLKLFDDPEKVVRAIALYRERFNVTGMFENSVYPEIPAALSALKASGARLFLATSKPRIYAQRIVEHFDLAQYLDAVHGSELDGTRTNKAELIAHVLQTQAVSPRSACMVGDRMHDMKGAGANGVFAVGVLWGYGSREELVAAGAAALCEQPARLFELLRKSLQR
jgi:phosphoglycolate phosphatase